MSTRLVGSRPSGARPRPWLGAWALIVLFLLAACATGVPRGGMRVGSSFRPPTPRVHEDARSSAAVARAEAAQGDVVDERVRLSLPTGFGAVRVSDFELDEALATLVLNMSLPVAGSRFPLYPNRKLALASVALTGEEWRTLLGTAAVGETAALVSQAPKLPGFAKAAGALESHAGISDVLTAVQEADKVKVAVAEGTFSVVLPANAVSMVTRGSPARADPSKKKPDVHHIATVENEVSTARGGPWTPRFKKLFDKAGVRMKDVENTVPIEGHKGPHPERYHRIVFRELDQATQGCRGVAECRAALTKALTRLAEEIATPGTELDQLVTRGASR